MGIAENPGSGSTYGTVPFPYPPLWMISSLPLSSFFIFWADPFFIKELAILFSYVAGPTAFMYFVIFPMHISIEHSLHTSKGLIKETSCTKNSC